MVGRRVWIALVVAFATFCIVQDRVTAAGARRYVALQKSALAGGGPQVTIDEIMRPAIDASVRYGALSAGAVLAAGLGWARIGARRVPDPGSSD
jgi:hypothetical protein